MSFTFGGSTSKTKSSTNSNSSSTTTPIVPQWGSDLAQSVAGRVAAVNQLNPQSLVAPEQPLHEQAATAASGLTGQSSLYDTFKDPLNYAINANAPRTGAVQAKGYVNDYLNPYLNQVVDATSADLDANEGRVRAQQALDLAGSGAFGGSGAALTQSMTEGELARARGSTLGALRSQAYDTALGAAQQDAARAQEAKNLNAQLYAGQMDRALGAIQQYANLANSYEANQRANIATQLGVADSLRGIDQAQREAPATSAQQVVAMLNGLPIGLFTGSQTNSTASGTSTSNTKGMNWGVGGDTSDVAKMAKMLAGG